MSKPSKNNRPSHSVYMVDGDGEKAMWTEIGALWAHDDGKGFNLNLRAVPLEGRLVIRERKPKGQAATGEAGQ